MRTGELYTGDADGREVPPLGTLIDYTPEDPDAARLRDGPLWERVLRVAGAILVTLYLALYAYDGLREPRVLDSGAVGSPAYEQLLGDANEGRVARVDVRQEYVRWQNRDGAVYQVNHSGIDFRAAVERQRYVRDHPGSVTYGAIERRDHGDLNGNIGIWLVTVALLLPLFRRAYPRRATRWGWCWPVWMFAGVPLYLLFSGSWVRTVPPPPHDRHPRRFGGWTTYAAAAVVSIVVSNVGERMYEDRHPIRSYDDREVVSPAELTRFVPGPPSS